MHRHPAPEIELQQIMRARMEQFHNGQHQRCGNGEESSPVRGTAAHRARVSSETSVRAGEVGRTRASRVADANAPRPNVDTRPATHSHAKRSPTRVYSVGTWPIGSCATSVESPGAK